MAEKKWQGIFPDIYLSLEVLGHGGVLGGERGVGGGEPRDRVHGLAVPLLQLGLGR